jgi:hygromycin-B 7''-O-kinase
LYFPEIDAGVFIAMNIPKITTTEDFQKHLRDDFWTDFARSICRRHKISFNRLLRSEYGENIVFLVDAKYAVKIYTPFRRGFIREKSALEFAKDKTSLIMPEVIFEGEIEGYNYIVLTQLKGISITRNIWLRLDEREQKSIVSQLAAGLRELHSHNAQPINFDWVKFVNHQTATVYARQKATGANLEWLERIPFYLEENLPLLPEDSAPVFLHGDVHFGNLRFIEKNGKWRISGLFDFADSLSGFHEYDFLAVGVLMIQGQSEIQREFLLSYGYKKNEINETLRRRLMLLTILYECSDLRKYALRLKPEAVNFTLDELEREIWSFV